MYNVSPCPYRQVLREAHVLSRGLVGLTLQLHVALGGTGVPRVHESAP